MLFETYQDQVLNLHAIAVDMRIYGLDQDFINKAVRLASFDQGIYDLMELWQLENSLHEKELILYDIKKSIDDYAE